MGPGGGGYKMEGGGKSSFTPTKKAGWDGKGLAMLKGGGGHNKF